jgi:superfamily II DNA/RNA helicase
VPQSNSGPRIAARRPRRPAGSARRPTAPPRREPSELDRALAAALAAPVPPAATFAELGVPAALVTALARGTVTTPFPIQARVLPDALAGRDVLGRAQTGSGKTLAFGLPMLARLAAAGTPRRDKAPRGLVLVPTRELAHQVAAALEPLSRAVGVSITTVYGGVPIGRQIDRLRRGVDIVVATPGRLIDLLERSACTLRHTEITVLDEADYLADLGFLPAVTRLLDATPAGGQRMLFSATLDRGVDRLVRDYLTAPAVHAVASATASVETAEHRVFILPAADKVEVAAQIAGRPGRTLFFVRTKHGADRLAKRLVRSGVDAAAIHGNLNQSQRQRALDAFTAGAPRVLIATDVAARGIHVDDVDLVVHFDPPNDHKDYLHRSGRTARAGAVGTVLALVEPGQVRDVAKLHVTAGIVPITDSVQPGDAAVHQVATSGEPVVPPAAGPARTPPEDIRRRSRPQRGGPRRPRSERAHPAGNELVGRPARRRTGA